MRFKVLLACAAAGFAIGAAHMDRQLERFESWMQRRQALITAVVRLLIGIVLLYNGIDAVQGDDRDTPRPDRLTLGAAADPRRESLIVTTFEAGTYAPIRPFSGSAHKFIFRDKPQVEPDTLGPPPTPPRWRAEIVFAALESARRVALTD